MVWRRWPGRAPGLPAARADLLAGVTVAAYAVPQVMAYAAVAGLPPVTGLWAATAALLVYALVGSSRRLSVGPESTTALLTAAAVGPLAGGDPARYAALAATLALLVALVCLAAWAARLGFLADLFSRPVLVGYMAGIAVLMIVSQLDTVTGVAVGSGSAAAQVASFLGGLGSAEPATTAVSTLTLAFLLGVSRAAPRLPTPLIAVVAATVLVAALPGAGVEVVGAVPAQLPAVPQLVSGSDVAALALPAVGLAVVAYTDNVLTARAFAARHHEQVDAGRELVALAAANAAAGAVQGFPVSSSGSRTAIGDAMGARSQLHSVVVAAAVVLVIGLLGPLLAAFPQAALGALVVYAALRLVDLGEFRRIARFRRSELVLALSTTLAVLLLDVLLGVVVAVGLSVLDLLRRVARPHDGILGYVPGLAGMHDVDDYPQARLVPGLLVYRYDSPLFFANADDFLRRALAALDQVGGPVHWFVLNAEANVQVDVTALDALDELHRQLTDRGVVLAMARVKRDLYADLERVGLPDRLGPDRIYATLPTAVEAYARWHAERFGRRPEGMSEPDPT